MIERLRVRLTVWYVSVLAAVLVSVCILIYVLLGRTLHNRVDANLAAVTGIAITSLTNDLAEGQSVEDAARSTAAELLSDQAVLAIYDGGGRRLAEARRDDDDARITLPPIESIPPGAPRLYTATEADDGDDRHRVAVRRARIAPSGTEYVIQVSTDLEPVEDELESLREILLYVVPAALALAGIVGWFLANQSLRPAMLMAQQQRQFMADASHELRTPVATARTAAAVALQRPSRSEAEYRDTLQIIEQQADRLTHLVDDMFTLARADAGNYPMDRAPVYLDELVSETARAARVLAAARQVTIECALAESVSFVGDEHLLKRLIANLVDNAVKHAPSGSVVRIELAARADAYVIDVSDAGAGVPAEARAQLFDRFFRGDAARRRDGPASGGAGLGLAIARWIARQHGGDVTLTQSTGRATTFRIVLPRAEGARP